MRYGLAVIRAIFLGIKIKNFVTIAMGLTAKAVPLGKIPTVQQNQV